MMMMMMLVIMALQRGIAFANISQRSDQYISTAATRAENNISDLIGFLQLINDAESRVLICFT